MEPKTLLLVALGGAMGAVLRYMVGNWLPSEPYPWSTLGVNLVGSLALGALACAAVSHEMVSETTMLFLGIGVLGAFTTLSTYSLE
ncbi:MAG: CrcB family protein, partial [Candidatus Poseidoniaceae archaeon]|nr:CrcB family protein [Candidatus Poseidoniaceae archaeon]